ncbi:MAG TPA: hypothetical protein VIM11_28185 [Tepidisphaeraceae bacterium]|jgi:hypothetical protein
MADNSLDYITPETPPNITPFRPWFAAALTLVPVVLTLCLINGFFGLDREATNLLFLLMPVLALPGLILGLKCRPPDPFTAGLAQFAIFVSLIFGVGAVLWLVIAIRHMPG